MSSRSPWSDGRASKREKAAPSPKPQPAAPQPIVSPAPIAEPAPVAHAEPVPARLPEPEQPIEQPIARLPDPPKPAKIAKPPKAPRPPRPSLGERLRPVVARARARTSETLQNVRNSSARTGRAAVAAWRECHARPAKKAPAIRLPPHVLPATLAIGVVLALSLVANGFGLVANDETPHVYLAERMAQGARAYVDFPSSRPVGLLWLLSIAARLHFGGPVAAQALACLAFVLAAVFVSLAARPFGRVAQVAAPLALLWAYEPLALATHPAGETFAMPLVAAAAWMLLSGRGLVAGALLAGGVSVSLPVIFPSLAFLAGALVLDRRTALKALAGFAALLGVFALLALALYGKAALTQPIELGLLLTSAAGPRIRLLPVIANGAGWLLLAALAPVLVSREARGRALVWLVAGLVPLAAIFASPALERQAAVPMWPLLALCAGMSISAVVSRYRAWSEDGAFAWGGRLSLAALVCVVAVGWVSPRLGAISGDPIVGRRFTRPEGAAGALARALFWRDEFALGTSPSWPTRILWRQSQRSPNIERMAQIVTRQSDEGQAVFGDGRVAPLVARAAGRPFAGDLVEPALTRLPAEKLQPFFEKVQQVNPGFLVFPSRRGLVSVGPFAPWAQRRFMRTGIFEDVGGEWVDVQGRRPGMDTAQADR